MRMQAILVAMWCSVLSANLSAQNKDQPKLIPVDAFSFDGNTLGMSASTFLKKYPLAVPTISYNGVLDVKIRSENEKSTRYIFIDGKLAHIEITYTEADLKRVGGLEGILDKLHGKYGPSKSEVSEDPKKPSKYDWRNKNGSLRLDDRRGKLKSKHKIEDGSIIVEWEYYESEVIVIGDTNKILVLLDRLAR